MKKKVSKTTDQRRLETRLAIFVVYTIQILIVAYTAFNSPFMAENFSKTIISFGILDAFIMLYTFDLKNIKGWWAKKRYQAEQRVMYRKEVEAEIARRNGLGYDKIKR